MHIRRLLIAAFYVVATLLSAITSCIGDEEVSAETLNHAVFGELSIYHPVDQPKGIVLLLSGDAGWDSDMAEMAKAIAGLDYLVVGIDGAEYQRRLDSLALTCVDVAADLENLNRFLEQRYHFSDHKAPIVVGYTAGASLAYTALAQAPAATLHAVISLEFCPRLPVRKDLCTGSDLKSMTALDGKGILLLPRKELKAPWFLFQSNQVCEQSSIVQFVNQTDNAKLVYLPGDGQQALGQKKWLPQLTALLQWLDPSIADQVQLSTGISGLPITQVLATGTANKRLAVMLSGDGGWAALDRGIAAELAHHGISTIGWDSLSYFWDAKTPDQASRDLERLLRYYLDSWKKERVLLIGYSFGADVLPFVANRLPQELRNRIELVAFLGLSDTASFEFHLTDWFGVSSAEGNLQVKPEVAKMAWAKRLCIYGEEEDDNACPGLADVGVTVVKMPGDHHFNDDYPGIVKRLLEQLSP